MNRFPDPLHKLPTMPAYSPTIPIMVNIQGIDKVALVKRLWEQSRGDALFVGETTTDSLNLSEVRRILSSSCPNFDRISGRSINCVIRSNLVNPMGYDRVNGWGAFQRVVNSFH